MHPEIESAVPGRCPECGMALVESQKTAPKGQKLNRATHQKTKNENFDKHTGHSLIAFAQKFWVSLILTVPVLLYSELLEKFFNVKLPGFPGSNYLPLILSSIVFFYGGFVFLASSFRELKARMPGMMTLIALAISVAYFYSIFAVLSNNPRTLFWELTTLITVMLLGHYLEMRAVKSVQGALKELSKLLPDTAEVIIQSSIRQNMDKMETKTIPVSELKINDLVFVRPGGKIPVDGKVVKGESDVNESMISGESKPVKKIIGSEVIAGTINGDGSLKIKVTKIGEQTFLAGVMRLVAEAESSKSRLQILSDQAAFYLTLVAVGGGILTFLIWIIYSPDYAFALERTVAVLVIACPHALGLAIPLVASISTTLAAKNGFLVKKRLSLELARKIKVVLFDKTGTLTTGKYGVDKIIKSNDISEKEILQLAASVDAHSEHFVAKAIFEQARKQKINLLPVTGFTALPGVGVRGKVKNSEIIVGGLAALEKNKISLPKNLAREIKTENQKGKTIIFIIKKNELWGAISLSDQIRSKSKEAIEELKKLGIKTAMLTGDSEEVAKWVAGKLKIDEYFARVLPQDKSTKVKILQKDKMKIAAVGDGINDAPMLTQADLGVAIGAGTNVAIESAGIILVKNDPRDIVKIIKLSRATFAKMVQNLFWATGYNVVALPLAAGVLAFKGILLQPALAALFMSLSTVIVAINAALLRRLKI
ncbi:heavy metal translocating P-type ATPase [Candidatus Berkelbacteria bacterium]|nr:heavy metal translocating P-type ATPase [Candidatus Berkelbacteria bacterium]